MENEAALIALIKKKIRAGYPEGELKNELLQKGYTREQIEQCMLDVSGKVNQSGSGNHNKTSMSLLGLLGAGLLITGISLLSTQTFLTAYAYYLIAAALVCIAAGFLFNRKRDNSGEE